MDATTVELIKTIATDAIKILGPAILAAYMTYKTAKMQFESKLRELENKNEFNTRVHLFNYYKDRERQLSQTFEKASRLLGEAVGYAEGYKDENLITFVTEVIQECYKNVPSNVEIAIRDMELEGLSNTQEYQKLKDILSHGEFEVNGSTEKRWGDLIKITGIYEVLNHCNQLVLQNRINSLFGKYMSPQDTLENKNRSDFENLAKDIQ